MANQLPAIGALGVYRLLAPFTIETTNYVCTQINQITSLIERQVDVFGLYYAPNNLSEDIYQQAIDNNLSIVTLESDDGPTIHVPSNYVDTTPVVPFVPYSRIVLSIDLGLLPDAVDLSQLQEDLTHIANEFVNFDNKVAVHSIERKAVSFEEHTVLEAARLNKLENYISIYKGKKDADARIANYETRIRLLEKTVIEQNAIINGE